MAGVVKGMEGAMRAMDLEKVPILSLILLIRPSQHNAGLYVVIRVSVAIRVLPHFRADNLGFIDIRCHGQIRDPIRGPGRRNGLL